ncbi:MAG: DUF4363 family protein [Clostridia bacterium]|nr:DUF4363 family protein [Clostridia bacterium]
MKGKIIAICIFLLILAGLVAFEVVITYDTVNKVKATNYKVIELAYADAESDMELYDRLDKIGDYWAERENLLCLIFNHKDMLEVGKEIEQAKSYLKLNNKDEAIVHLELLAEDILSMEHILYFNLPNLL